jgi:hypothetical protein
MSDNDPQVLEKEKKEHLEKDDKSWNEKLASFSEASVSNSALKAIELTLW